MPKYLIEREMPNASELTAADLQGIAERSNAALRALGTDIQWIQSYVTGDKMTCIYIAKNEELVYAHAKSGRFPANRVSEIIAITDPTTEDAKGCV